MKNETPIARFDNIIVQELTDEILVCDTTNNRMFCLNKTAAEVWKLADGTRNIKEISRLLSKTFKSDFSEELVSFALAELSREKLLMQKIPVSETLQHLSRREVIRRVGLASMIALPVISSLTMPKAVHASSTCIDNGDGLPGGCECQSSVDCESFCCAGGTCSEIIRGCEDDTCPPGYVCCGAGSLNSFCTRCPRSCPQ